MSERFHDPPDGVLDDDRELHAVMACGLVPMLMLPLSWWLTLRRLFGRDRSQSRARLRRRLLAIAVFDTALALALGVALVTRGIPDAEAGSDPPRIGVQVDVASDTPGAKVASVWRASPAERAGLRQGDVIRSIDGTPIEDWEGLSNALRAGRSGSVRHLSVRRDGADVDITITPLSGLGSDPAPRPLFEPEPGQSCGASWTETLTPNMWPAGLGCLFIGAIGAWGAWRRRRSGRRAEASWLWVLAPLLAAPVIGVLGAREACKTAGGWSTGVALVGLVAQGLGMLAIGLLVLRMLRTRLDAHMGPRLSTVRAARLAVLYIASAMARAAIALYVLMALVPELQGLRGPGVDSLISATNNPLGRAMMISAAVVVAPLAEEVVFRGILLPGLARHMKTQSALIVSATLFGLFHVPSHGIGAIMPGLLGLVFGWARLRTGSLAAPILLHAANNLLVTLLAWGA